MGYLDNKGLEKYTWNVRNRVAKNEQMTKVKPLVSFCPAPETDLEPIVNFAVKETLPAEGTKGPDNPSTIAGVSEIKLSRCGKNLFPLSKAPKYNDSQTINDVTFTMNEDGWITCNGTASARTSYFFVVSGMRIKIPAGTYTISGMPDALYGQSVGLNICTYLSFNPDTGFWNTATDTGNGATFTTTDARYMVVGIAVASGVKFENYVIKPQLEVGSKATSFEPYKGNDFSFSLNGTYYGGSVNLATGLMTVTWEGDTFTQCNNRWDNFNGLTQTNDTVSFQVNAEHNHALNYNIVSNMFTIGDSNYGMNQFTHRGANTVSTFKCSMAKSALDLSNVSDPNNLTAEETYAAVNAFLSSNPLFIAYELTTPFTVQLTPQQIRSLLQSDPYIPQINTVYTDQESVQVGWIREDVVHKSGKETIEGTKTFKNTNAGHVSGETTTEIIIRNPSLIRGIPSESGRSYTRIVMADAEGDIEDTFAGRLGLLEIRSPMENDTLGEELSLGCYRYSSNSINNTQRSLIGIGYDINEIAYATAPSTSENRSNPNDIVTRNWANSKMWNWQKTQEYPAVTFNPVSDSILEPKINFIFTETNPVSGEKSPDNPSIITGVDSCLLGHFGDNILSLKNQTGDINGITYSFDSNGVLSLDGTCTQEFTIYNSSERLNYKLFTGDTITFKSEFVSGTYTASETGLIKNQIIATDSITANWWPGVENFGTHTHTATKEYKILATGVVIRNGASFSNCQIKIQINVNNSQAAWSPAGCDVYNFSFGSNYYGGSLDVNSGLLTINWFGEALSESNFSTVGVSQNTVTTMVFRTTKNHGGGNTTSNSVLTCNRFQTLAGSDDVEHCRFSGAGSSDAFNIYIDRTRLDLSGVADPASPTALELKTAMFAWLANNPTFIVYQFLEPYTIQLTPTQIVSLPAIDKYTPRINTIYTDAASVQVGYQRYADEHKNADSASKLQTSVSLKTNLASTTAITFDGSTDQNSIPVSGILPISNGGTGSSTQNFVDLSNSQVINGVKTFGSTIEGVVDRSIKDGSGNVIANTYATKAVATSLADGLMSSTDKSKLDSIGTVFNFKGSVADTASLPGSGNTAGDAYLVQSPLGLQAWNGTSWVDIGSSALLPISDNEIDAVFA